MIYTYLGQMEYIHNTVHHQQYIVDSVTYAHT